MQDLRAMQDFIENSVFFGVVVSLFSFWAGTVVKKRFGYSFFNPLLIAIILTILILLGLRIDYAAYYEGAKYISYLLTPATICLAIPLYEQMELLKNNLKIILAGILSGVLTSLCSIFAMSLLFGLSRAEYVTLLPKSVTTAIGMGISEELGGYVSITAAVIIVTGILGSVIAEALFKIFHITEPIAKGIALGTASHAIGTAKAMELGETEGAMSSLSIVVAGILTVAGASIFAHF